MGDATSYHEWASEIAAGDIIGQETFYQAPLYPYFLGTIYTFFGDSVTTVRVIQSLIGSVSCVFMLLTVWRLMGPRAGIAAGVVLACYAPAIFFDGIVQKSVLDLAFLSASFWFLSRWCENQSLKLACVIGAVTGCLLLTRENALLLVPVFLAWVWVKSAELKWKSVALVVVGIAFVLLPVAVRNKVVGGEFHLTTSQFGPNFYIGNNPDADGIYRPLRARRAHPKFERQDAFDIAAEGLGKQPTAGEVSSYFVRQSLDFITSQPASWLKLMARKFALTWNSVELVDTEDQYTFADWSLPLRVTGYVGHFGVLVVMAAAGICVTWQDRRELWFLHVSAAVYFGSVLLFYLMARYRFPLVPMLIPFAAAAITKSRDFFRSASSKQRIVVITITLAACVFSNWPFVAVTPMRAATLYNIGAQLDLEGRGSEAIPFYQQSLAIRPDSVEALYNLGHALARQGELPEAIESYQRAVELNPNYIDAHINLALAQSHLGQFDVAVDRIQHVLKLAPKSAKAYNNLGSIYATRGKFDDAEKYFKQAADLDSSYAEPLTNLGMLAAQNKDLKAAVIYFERAFQLDPNNVSASFNLGNIFAEQGQYAKAVEWYRRTIGLNPNFEQAYVNLRRAESLMRGN